MTEIQPSINGNGEMIKVISTISRTFLEQIQKTGRGVEGHSCAPYLGNDPHETIITPGAWPRMN